LIKRTVLQLNQTAAVIQSLCLCYKTFTIHTCLYHYQMMSAMLTLTW